MTHLIIDSITYHYLVTNSLSSVKVYKFELKRVLTTQHKPKILKIIMIKSLNRDKLKIQNPSFE